MTAAKVPWIRTQTPAIPCIKLCHSVLPLKKIIKKKRGIAHGVLHADVLVDHAVNDS
jgi:hypothetical protein